MDVRKAGGDEAEALCELTATVWRRAYVDVLGEEVVEAHLAETNDPETLRENYREHDLSTFVVVDPLVAQATCRPAEGGDTLYLTQLYVHPERWGEGVGTRLLDRVEREARDRDRECVALVVLDGNERARGFYEARGYEQVGVREESITEDVEELRYEKRLDG
ncbi:GNAT family N-acetyltransferase [Halorarius halobius]|uniref:GNAT family N-acetyltransferase n=1 Tax=Halorarius halobius TaxID=2962671 RepID=UPI0020CD15C3|nr:GNAT family N-acetyltransferase [Halorarius halobius]